MKKETILAVVVALIVGTLGGFLLVSLTSKKSETPSTGGVPAGAGAPADYQQRISEAEKIVARDPKNLQAWKQLGNDYFDTDQPMKAIEAYNKVLEFTPTDVSVLTDQGIMYRRVGWFDKAIANFEKVQKVDPKHLQSLYNIGVVYAEDLKQPDKAIAAFTRFLEIDPTNPNAPQIRGYIDRLKAQKK